MPSHTADRPDCPTRIHTRLQHYPQGGPLRTTLLIVAPAAVTRFEPLRGGRLFWLVEQTNRKVFFYAVERPDRQRSIGGRVVHDLRVLDPAADWVKHLAALAARCAAADLSERPLRQTLVRGLERREQQALATAVAGFRAALDPEVLAILAAEGAADAETYNHYWEADGTPARNARQAAQVYPWFQDALRDDWHLRQTVRKGGTLAPALAERFGVPRATLRRCRALHPADIASHARSQLLNYAAAYPADFLPSSVADWSAFHRLAPGIQDLANLLGVQVHRFAASFANGWQQGAADLHRRVGSALDTDAVFDLMHATYYYGVRPAVAAWLMRRNHPANLATSPPAAFFPTWFGRYNLPRLHAMAQRWRLAFGEFASARRLGTPAGGRLAWPALVDAVTSDGPLRFVELTSLEDLELEGQRLQHCVGSYAVKCLLSGSCVYSVRDQAGNPLSTFEIDTGGSTPRLARHYARGNAEPPTALQNLVTAFVDQLRTHVSPTRIAQVHRTRRALGEPLRARLGKPDQASPPLEPAEAVALHRAIAFAHPAEARREGIVTYLGAAAPALLQEILRANADG